MTAWASNSQRSPIKAERDLQVLDAAVDALKIQSLSALYGGDWSAYSSVKTLAHTAGTGKGGAAWIKGAGGGVQTTGLTELADMAAGYVVDAAGNYWHLATDQTITPLMFGALLDNVADEYAQMQAFFDFVGANRVDAAADGTAKTSATLLFTGGAGTAVNFNLKLIATAAMNEVIKFSSHSGIYHPGKLMVEGAGGATYANRLCRDGIVFESCRGAKFDFLQAENIRRIGVHGPAGTNNTLLSVGELRTHYVGPSKTANYELVVPYTGKTDTGSASSISQRSVLTMVPPDDLAVNDICAVDGEPYIVTAFDAGAGTVTVFPWLRTAATSGDVKFYCGGGIKIEGVDAASLHVGRIDATYCSTALRSASLYGCKAQRIVTQYCGIGITIGNNSSSNYYGNTIDAFYTEGNDFDIVKTTSGFVGLVINGMYEVRPENFYSLSPRAASKEYDGVLHGMHGVTINAAGEILKKLPHSLGLGGYATTYTVVADNQLHAIKGGNSVSIALALNADREREFGHNHLTFIVYGRRTGNRVDSITFTPDDVAHTVNGGASVVIGSVTTQMLVTAFFDYEASNWVIKSVALT